MRVEVIFEFDASCAWGATSLHCAATPSSHARGVPSSLRGMLPKSDCAATRQLGIPGDNDSAAGAKIQVGLKSIKVRNEPDTKTWLHYAHTSSRARLQVLGLKLWV